MNNQALQRDREMFDHLVRMQKRIMPEESQITYTQWLMEYPEERERYYNWMLKQCGELADLI